LRLLHINGRLLFFGFFDPQPGFTTVSKSWTLPLWPSIFAVALLVDLQRSVEFCRSPFLPPWSSRTNLETGASGTEAKVLRTFEVPDPFLWTESMKPTRLTWI
jgi:hypothetical protein